MKVALFITLLEESKKEIHFSIAPPCGLNVRTKNTIRFEKKIKITYHCKYINRLTTHLRSIKILEFTLKPAIVVIFPLRIL